MSTSKQLCVCVAAMVAALWLGACEKAAGSAAGASAATTKAAIAGKKTASPVTGAAASAARAAAAGGLHGATPGLTGTVLETIEAGKYTYLRLDRPGGAQWAAVPRAVLAAGQRVTVANPMLMRDFESKTLNRKFATIYFGVLGQGAETRQGAMGAKGAPAAANQDVAMAHRGVTEVKDVAQLQQPLNKAEGASGRSIAEIYDGKQKLADKMVRVRGKVTKVNNGIMGRNWVHLQDGTRSTGGGHDLTVTTQAQLAVGQVIVMEGTLATDRDLGAGYRYPVILEKAEVKGK